MKFITLITFVMLVTACSSSPVYRQAGSSGFGYQDSQLSQTQHRISYKVRGRDSGKAHDLAMLRAAELTLLQGYDWFEVLDRETIKEDNQKSGSSIAMTRQTETVRSCGLLGCTTSHRPSSEMTVGIGVDSESDSVERHLEIFLGKGVRPDKTNIYNATEIRNNMRHKYKL